jgi:uncharacterized membrane protein
VPPGVPTSCTVRLLSCHIDRRRGPGLAAPEACGRGTRVLSLRPMRPPWEELEPASRGAVQSQHQAVRRIEQLATVVFAASMALLVILLVDRVNTSSPQGSDLARILPYIWPAVGACAIGFLALLASWFLYHLQFHYLTQSSGWLLFMHALLLPSALLVPFSTALFDALSLTRDAVLLVEANVLLVQVVLLLIWRHAVKGGLLFGSNVPSRVVRHMKALLRAGVSAMLVVIALALLSAPASLGALVAVLLGELVLVVKGGYTLDIRAPRVPTPGL